MFGDDTVARVLPRPPLAAPFRRRLWVRHGDVRGEMIRAGRMSGAVGSQTESRFCPHRPRSRVTTATRSSAARGTGPPGWLFAVPAIVYPTSLS